MARINYFINKESNLFAENRLLKFGFVLLLIITLINSVSISQLDDNIRTHVVPIGGEGNFILSGNTGSDDYLRAMMQYVVHMMGNINASTAKSQLADLLEHFHGDVYGKYKEEFRQMSEAAERVGGPIFPSRRRAIR